MSYIFKTSKQIIDNILEDLKRECYIEQDSIFIHKTENNPSKELYYNDYGFLDSVGYYRSKETIDHALEFLKEKMIIANDTFYSSNTFDAFSYKVKKHFIVPWKSFTPTMERLVFMLSSVKKPMRIIAVGVNCGYTIAWIIGRFWKENNLKNNNVFFAVEKDPLLLNTAKHNIGGLNPQCNVEYFKGDAFKILDEIEDDDFDMAFLDTRRDIRILEKLYKKIKKNGWLLMHNASDTHFKSEMSPFLNFVRDKNYFSESILFNVDTKGLELSIKR